MKRKISKLIFMFIVPIAVCLSLGIFLAGGFVSGYASALVQNGGCFSVGNRSTMNVGTGTTISGFSAVNGGGVYVSSGGTLTMNGGTISGNSATSGNGHNVYNAGTFTMNGGTIGTSGNAKTYGIYNAGTMKLLGGTVHDNIYSSSTFTTSPSATLNGTITLYDSAIISIQDYAGVTPELKIKISTSRSAGTILTFSGSSTQPDLTKITISGVDVNASNVEIVQGSSSSEWNLNFSKKTYTLTFDADGGVCSETSKTVTYGTKVTDLPTPTKDGYTFGGWYVQTGTTPTRVNLGREYMFTDKISVHFEAYSDNWADVADQIIISCTEDGGWNIEGNTASSGYIIFTIYDKEAGAYKRVVTNKKWTNLTAGWHAFDLIFDGEYAMIYVDKIKLGTSQKFTSNELTYNPTNSIMLGCEAGLQWNSYDLYTAHQFFVGKIANVVIQNTDELYSSDSLTTWMAPAQNVTLHARWSLVDQDFPSDWQTQVASTTYMTTIVTPSTLISVIFDSSVPTGYTQIGTLSTGLKVYQSSSDATKIAFVNSRKIYAPENSSYLFSNTNENNALKSLTTLTFNNFDTSKVTNMSYMFCACIGLTTLNLSNFNTSNVIDMAGMFLNCSGLTTLNLSSFDMTKVTSCSNMLNFGTNGNLRHLETPYNNKSAIPITNGSGITLYDVSTGDSVSFVPANLTESKTYASKITITFDANGGSFSTSVPTYYYGVALNTLPTPTKSGYSFDGWFNGAVEVTMSTALYSDTTLKASWTANSSGGGGGGGDAGIYATDYNGSPDVDQYGDDWNSDMTRYTIDEQFYESLKSLCEENYIEFASFTTFAFVSKYVEGLLQEYKFESIGSVGRGFEFGRIVRSPFEMLSSYDNSGAYAIYCEDGPIGMDLSTYAITTLLSGCTDLQYLDLSGLAVSQNCTFRLNTTNTVNVILPTRNDARPYSVGVVSLGGVIGYYYDCNTSVLCQYAGSNFSAIPFIDITTYGGFGLPSGHDIYEVCPEFFTETDSDTAFVIFSAIAPELYEEYNVTILLGDEIFAFARFERKKDFSYKNEIGEEVPVIGNAIGYGFYTSHALFGIGSGLRDWLFDIEYQGSSPTFGIADMRGVYSATYATLEGCEFSSIITSQFADITYPEADLFNYDGTPRSSTFTSSTSKFESENSSDFEINEELQVILDDEKKRYFATKQDELDDDSDGGEQEN